MQKSFEGLIVTWRFHYPLLASGAGFQRWYFQTESRISDSHHGIDLYGDYITNDGVFAEEKSSLKS